MPNRAERRAQSKRSSTVGPPRYDTSRRSNVGLSDERALQERSRRLAEHRSATWTPVSSTQEERMEEASTPAARAGSSLRGVMRIISWTLIVLSMIAFLTVMWLPSHPAWLIILVSAVFVIGVLSLFLTAEDARFNTHVDEHGTAL
ncbi:tripartite tricarboxylate transporter TctB family protein [Bifidobacterium mongoliense]|uniref:tripartite tricarboxylate transporter TctB family protein n=1 Tax=Bifidobacterium mongoliense TaxID=518643 RepID=UPI0026479265|nr:tripartite tricarboxylate transporter TctB family protein [Bifidobacterium mongoliense]MDN5632826.1 tripartite tricarboxylate transporter TctB family protein [Bifidobacterium mongoliense]MDN6016918.1 tripartite tricarboxylate transporter TctB family protein [Bifidobacterium mongoliense]